MFCAKLNEPASKSDGEAAPKLAFVEPTTVKANAFLPKVLEKSTFQPLFVSPFKPIAKD